MEKNNTRILYGIIAMFVILLGVYSNNMLYADAVSTINVTFIAGTTTTDIDYSSAEGSDSHTAYVIGQNAGQAYVWKTSSSPLTTYTILFNVTLTGSTSARAIEWNPDTLFVYAVTNDKVYKLSQSLGIAGSLATGTANIIQELYYDSTNEVLYYCTNDGYGSINTSTLALTNLYSDPQANSVLGCDFDIPNNVAVLAGNNIGSTLNCELVTVSLTTHTEANCVNSGGSNIFYSVCVDDVNSKYWALGSSDSNVKKYSSALSLEATVTVGTVPRNCSINTDETGRRLYVANEGTDTISILDIDANVVLTSPSVCDTVADRKIATHRTSNTTHTFVTCNSNVNSVVIDDTVSDFIPTPSASDEFCSQPENENILICRLEDSPPLTGSSELLNQSSTNIVCMVALLECTQDEEGNFTPINPDIKTNGVGYLVTIVTFGILISIFWLASGGRLGDIPTFVWFIATLAVLGLMVGFDFLDITFLLIGVISIIALAVAKAKGLFGDVGLFKGE